MYKSVYQAPVYRHNTPQEIKEAMEQGRWGELPTNVPFSFGPGPWGGVPRPWSWEYKLRFLGPIFPVIGKTAAAHRKLMEKYQRMVLSRLGFGRDLRDKIVAKIFDDLEAFDPEPDMQPEHHFGLHFDHETTRDYFFPLLVEDGSEARCSKKIEQFMRWPKFIRPTESAAIISKKVEDFVQSIPV